MSGPTIVLTTTDGGCLEFGYNLCMHSNLVKDMLTNLGIDKDSVQPLEVPVGDVINAATLQKVKEYTTLLEANKHKLPQTISIPNGQENGEIEIEAPSYIMQNWEIAFSEVLDGDELYNLMMAGNYLDIGRLLEMCTTVVANMIRGRPADEVREILGVECDFTEEELERIHVENVWLAD
ncbi:E3 ubiquitin ligase complex SCF subunit [Aphelenchoides bicaudatus]|nr:E3 ubiquitin ligase complex SCF subunit [Aphelenchoides bicaudatus]